MYNTFAPLRSIPPTFRLIDALHSTETGKGCPLQFFPVVGMRDRDQGPGSLLRKGNNAGKSERATHHGSGTKDSNFWKVLR